MKKFKWFNRDNSKEQNTGKEQNASKEQSIGKEQNAGKEQSSSVNPKDTNTQKNEKQKETTMENNKIDIDTNLYMDTLQLVGGEKLPTVPLRGMTILPGMVIHFDLSRDKSVQAVEKAMNGNQRLLVVTQKDPDEDSPTFEKVHDVGTMCMVKQVSKLPNNIVRVLVEGMSRAVLQQFEEEENYILTQISYVKDVENEVDAYTKSAMSRSTKEAFSTYHAYFPKIGKGIAERLEDEQPLGELLDKIAIDLPIDYEKKQKVLSAVKLADRFEVVNVILHDEVEIVKIKNDLSNNVRARLDKNQKDYVLREQMHYIKEELGDNNTDSDVEQFLAQVEELWASDEVKERMRKEIKRFQNIAGSAHESAVERTYIETLLELPWDKVSEDSNDLDQAEQILNDDHYGLEKVKERVLEFLAVRTLTGKGESPIICLVGPPGTGKTSIAKSIAKALNKKYVRICLGGVRDEAEIRGHRKTYVGAMPGRIAEAMKQAGVKNPLLLLDEIDKMSSDYKGDPSAALLEVMDGEQNNAFRDHYVEIPMDLSEVMFITTANGTDGIPRPLLDRMELIELNSYTVNEKFHIAKEHLVTKQLEKNGIREEELEFSDNALRDIIRFYTKEAGVRGLERQIGAVCRKEAREVLKKRAQSDAETANENIAGKVVVTPDNLEHYLGKHKFREDSVNKTNEVGIVRGLAWTSVGGDTLQIEVNVMPGDGKIDLTGQMGDVMKESARIAMSYVRSVSAKYQIDKERFKENDFHLHIPEGAVPKDGPSAGITMTTAFLSAVTNKPVRADLAMTGEVTLRGKVLPIGGLKEKLLAAKLAGVKTVLVPKDNEKDVAEIPEEITEGLTIVYVESMDEVIEQAFACEE